MSDILIRNVPDNVVAALSEKARAAGMDRQTWLLSQLEQLATQPLIQERYAYRVYGVNGKGVLRRHSDHPNGVSETFSKFSQEEADSFKKAADYIRRNAPGDREKAVVLLQSAFEEVIEIPA